MSAGPIKVMLVDDSSIIRRLLGRVLDTDPQITIAGQAENGVMALERLDEIDPDIVILDIEMPVMNGLETVTRLRRRRPTLPVIMFSTLTESGAAATLEALSRGADDYVTKPSNTGSFDRTALEIKATLAPKIHALVDRRRGRPRLRFATPATPAAPAAPAPPPERPVDPATRRPLTPVRPRVQARAATTPATAPRPSAVRPVGRPEVVVIGVSTGGPSALASVIPQLPATFGVPVLVVQHMPPIFTRLLAERLDGQSALSVAEAHDGAVPQAGQVWFAPGGKHMRVVETAGRAVIRLDESPPLHSCRPAVDPLFTSAVQTYGGRVLGVVLTGMGRDGFDGAAAIGAAGGQVVVQDEETSTVWGMPGIVAEGGLAQQVLALDEIAGALITATGGSSRLSAAPPLTRTSRG
ncbi:chemotaxis-specific protein-glutamate methyltransferase CheB [Euzebya sp.]|uniref:chemotaxis-specific protein-glutamate methyltransferase CheB n=1 Tax=Euzebya sp. TaxID=1971409 RepID=UPI003514556F